ncbi:hypothetical protein SAMD00019534_051060 [Acytostelium subglobosum LB1]|uniref:hypothetical protein n=1 Tax=Acytostelium subglobosum LB1 TaxID=1410327 RepID=UPI0006448E54|nr:hypothetical protein SAMD00019534_051060 [Acytostelium subglobosum LB1]GAM21931.1 hypothetical protein SAMD00019534_051060 [Acytostelium subglobosum LB1]|eukprot:XP_012755031.1 hypothetical protein SAMD00019534_051060 [Acytostelium subglobosum LB1]
MASSGFPSDDQLHNLERTNSTNSLASLNMRRHGGTEAQTYSSEFEGRENEELKVSMIIVRSDFGDCSAEEQSKTIVDRFNGNVKETAFTMNPLLGRGLDRVDISHFVLGQRNQIAELFDPRGKRFSTIYTVDPTVEIKYLGSYSKTAHYFGAFGKYVLNVPAGYYAKGYSKNRPVLYGEGPHVIVDPTFQFDQSTGFVNQQEPYISHSTINILRVPSGKIAKVWLGTQPVILESRREPYVFVDAQFRLVAPDASASKTNLFYNSISPYIEHGSIKRLIPHTGEVAVTYDNGILTIIKTPKDGRPVVIDSATHNFECFLPTSLQTCLFPSKETKAQALIDNQKAGPDEVNLKVFQTRDSLRVGVILVVAYKIIDPELAITKLGKEGIVKHIENVSFADMGKAIQLSTLQEVMFFTNTKPGAPDTKTDTIQTIQDRVKTNLAKDLMDYGIELSRLQIETIKVLDAEIAKKLAGQSVTSAEFTTKQATLAKEYDIKTTEARLKAETDNIAVAQKNQATIADSQAKLTAAQNEAQSLLIKAEAERKASEMQGELFAKFPALLELEMAKIKAMALQGATIYIAPESVGNFLNSPLVYLDKLNGSVKK